MRINVVSFSVDRSAGLLLGTVALAGFLANAGCAADAADPLEALAVPAVSAPLAGEAVRSPVAVIGTGEAAATVEVVIRRGDEEIGAADGMADATGSFALDVEFTPRAVFDTLRSAQFQGNPYADYILVHD